MLTDEQLLRVVANTVDDPGVYAASCPHGDTCYTCRDRRLYARVAKEFLDAGDTGPGSFVRCSLEFEERRRAQPSNN